MAGWVWALLFLLVALGLRLSTFGNANLGADDQFYLLVGERMHTGVLPYVDVWDRKPLGLFLIYYAIAALPHPVLSYQIVATLFAGATAWTINRMTITLAGPQGATLAGLSYLIWLGPLGGMGGQSPVFYNLFIALTFARVLPDVQTGFLDRNARRRVDQAMMLCGMAITIKQSSVFESVFLGLWILAAIARNNPGKWQMAGLGLRWLAIGMLPFAAIAASYAVLGHWPMFWQAMVLANLHKGLLPPARLLHLAITVTLRTTPMLAVAIWGWLTMRRQSSDFSGFVGGWLAAALLGFAAVPNLYVHYSLPLLVPGCVAGAVAFARGAAGRVVFVALCAWAFIWYDPSNFALNRQAQRDMQQLAMLGRSHGAERGLLVFDGPVYLYAMTGAPFLSPLVFPHHLNHAIERNVSHIDTDQAVTAMLARQPGVVVMSLYPRNLPINTVTTARVTAYIRSACRLVGVVDLHEEMLTAPIGVFGDCRPPVLLPTAAQRPEQVHLRERRVASRCG